MYDIIFISRNNKSSELDFNRLKQTWPFAKTANSFRDAQKKSTTKLFWAVWPDVIVDINFNFDYRPPAHEEQYIHIWPNSADRNLPAVGLFPKNKEVTDTEIENRFFSGMIKMNTIASHTKYYDVVFISFNEEYADDNYQRLVAHASVMQNNVLRVSGIKGIHQAHIAAANLATTNMFYVVDADAIISENFKFNLLLSEKETDIVHVWRSQNPINGLEYGNGGVKLLPRELTLNLDVNSTDMTTSISSKFKVMPAISNITKFNTSPFNTWRSAFRECAKLSSGVIHGDELTESQLRLNTWLYQGGDSEFGEYAKGGASAGQWYGTTYKDDPKALAKINDYEWLEIQFNEHVAMFPPETFKDLKDPSTTDITPMSAWISGFRECAELSKSSMPNADRIQELLYNGHNEYSRGGASAGKWFGETYKNDPANYAKIEDDSWLEGEFYYHIETHPPETFK